MATTNEILGACFVVAGSILALVLLWPFVRAIIIAWLDPEDKSGKTREFMESIGLCIPEFDDDIDEYTEEMEELKAEHPCPTHYGRGKVESIQVIREMCDKLDGLASPYQGYCIGNVLKYLSRYPLKGGVEDLVKARNYLDYLIESIQQEG